MDPELEALRAQKMAEIQQQYGGGMGGGGMPSQEQQQQQEQKKEMEQMQRNSLLSQILDQPARARLNTISLTKPEKAKAIESMLIQMAQRRQIQGKLGEEQLKGLLEQVSQKTTTATKVKFDRRRAQLSSDEDDY